MGVGSLRRFQLYFNGFRHFYKVNSLSHGPFRNVSQFNSRNAGKSIMVGKVDCFDSVAHSVVPINGI